MRIEAHLRLDLVSSSLPFFALNDFLAVGDLDRKQGGGSEEDLTPTEAALLLAPTEKSKWIKAPLSSYG